MKKVSATTLVLGTFALLVTSAPAQHRLLHHARPGTNGSAGCCYVEQKIICYKAVTKTKTVPITTKKEVSKVVEEPFKFVEMVQVTTPEKRVEKYFVCATKDVPFTYKVCVPITVQQKQTVTYFESVQKAVVVQVPVCRPVTVTLIDPCTGCPYSVCQYITELQNVTTVVTQCVPKSQDVVVNVPSVKVEDRTGTYKVSEMVEQSREVTVNVVSCKAIEKSGVIRKLVSETVIDMFNVTQTYCEMVPYEMVVRVPVSCCPKQ
jgi:hypothetical protein